MTAGAGRRRVTLDATAAVLPGQRMTAADIGALTGLDTQVVADRIGVREKRVAPPDVHVSELAAAAGRRLLEAHDVDPASVDAVCYFGSTWKDHAVWQVAPWVTEQLGCRRAFALELDYTSCGAPVAVRVARGLLASEDQLRTVLLVGASVESRLVDYRDPSARSTFGFGDGAVAGLLVRDGDGPAVVGSHMVTDGSFSRDVLVPAGGSRADAGDGAQQRLRVADHARLKERLDPVTLPAFLDAVDGALKAADCDRAGLDRAFVGHLKPSMHARLRAALGLDADRMPYLADTGHVSGVDPLLALHRAWVDGRLRPGETCLLLAAGTGYTWAATALRVPAAFPTGRRPAAETDARSRTVEEEL